MAIDWDDVSTLVLMKGGAPEPSYYLLEGEAANEVVDALKENTEATADNLYSLQTHGSGIVIYASSQGGSPRYRFVLDYQYVEGLGDKRDWDREEADTLLSGQRTRRAAVLELISTKDQAIPREQFEGHDGDFKQLARTWLWWKN